ncbi:DUF4440 domain-containing protein [Dactylosporangium sp. CA-092794]|uniref:DUF4440 domain-containing protein n=1 Tax=Dactylosporangium sp. CA-092794 TaxID=3239929 RepID=UPI003D949AE9
MSVDNQASGDRIAADENAVRLASEHWARAHREHDEASAARLMAEEFRASQWQSVDGALYLTLHFGGSIRIDDYVTSVESVAVRADAAVVTGRRHLVGARAGREVDTEQLVTETWVRAGAGWRLLALHASERVEEPRRA